MAESTQENERNSATPHARVRKESETAPRKRRSGQHPSAQEVKDAKKLFLSFFKNSGIFRVAAEASNVDRVTVYRWLEKDAQFKKDYEFAEEDANDLLRGEIFRRAYKGVTNPAISGGRLVYEYDPVLTADGKPVLDKHGKPKYKRGKKVMITEYSDTLTVLHAKARMAEYRDKQEIDHKGLQALPAINFTLTTEPPPEPQEPPEPTFEQLAESEPGDAET